MYVVNVRADALKLELPVLLATQCIPGFEQIDRNDLGPRHNQLPRHCYKTLLHTVIFPIRLVFVSASKKENLQRDIPFHSKRYYFSP